MLSPYNELLVHHLYNKFKPQLNDASAGHCMKLTGVSDDVLMPVLEQIKTNLPRIDVFILANDSSSDVYITATKLIELRNLEENPLLVIIPANLRTAAEDSFGNATFQALDISDIEARIYNDLYHSMSNDIQTLIEEEVFNFLKSHNIFSVQRAIQFLIAFKQEDFDRNEAGDLLYHFNLLPDDRLFEEISKTKVRLNINIQCVQNITAFNKSVYDRVNTLRITKNPPVPYTPLKMIQQFLKKHRQLKTGYEIGKEIIDNYPKLNFGNWHFPEIEKMQDLKVNIFDIASKNNLSYNDDGELELKCTDGKDVKVKITFTTNPPPNVASDLIFFVVDLMKVDGGYEPERVDTLIKFKNSKANSEKRSKQFVLSSSTTDEGYYFFRIIATDEHGTQLNLNDDFQDKITQEQWETEQQEQDEKKADRSKFTGKLRSDSDTFYLLIDDQNDEEEEVNEKKNKVPTVLHAYFANKIKLLKEKKSLPLEPHERDWTWISLDEKKLESTFLSKYTDTTEQYQISLPYKLYLIEKEILTNPRKLGVLETTINSVNAISAEDIHYSSSILNDLAPIEFLDAREALFEAISKDNQEEDWQLEKIGIIETFKFYEHIPLIENYLSEYSTWINTLINASDSFKASKEQTKEIVEIRQLLQFLDTINLTTKLPNQDTVRVILLSPLHPLRLSWTLQLWKTYNQWESATIKHPQFNKYWDENLEQLLLQELYPTNNPLVLSQGQGTSDFEYAGELRFGWGLYVRSRTQNVSNSSMGAKSRLLLRYVQVVLNIQSNNFSENDVKPEIITRHIKNYIKLNPYVEQLNINLFNVGEAQSFVDALIELEKDNKRDYLRYEIRIFTNSDKIVQSGKAFRTLLNPAGYPPDGSESFIETSANRLFPKIRFSILEVSEFIQEANKFDAHLSFLVNPFPLRVTVFKPLLPSKSFYLNGLVTHPQVDVNYNQGTGSFTWTRFIYPNNNSSIETEIDSTSIFSQFQKIISTSLTGKLTDSLPATQLSLTNIDRVLIEQVHEYSEWVVTFDRHLGPEIFDSPRGKYEIPFLLDYIPDDNIMGISTFLTTKPSARIRSILTPHLHQLGLDTSNKQLIYEVLEDLRAVSGSILMKLSSNENTVLEILGIALAKRFLQSQGILKNQFIVPIDLHQYLFDKEKSEEGNKSRADLLLVSLNKETKKINFQVIEIKARSSNSLDKNLITKIDSQLNNTQSILENHFQINKFENDRLDRSLKNKELSDLLSFYINRAERYKLIDLNTKSYFLDFLNNLESGYELEMDKMGLVFLFNSDIAISKDSYSDMEIYTIGKPIIQKLFEKDYEELEKLNSGVNELTKRLTRRIQQSGLVKQIKKMMTAARSTKKTKPTEPLASEEVKTTPPILVTPVPEEEVKIKSTTQPEDTPSKVGEPEVTYDSNQIPLPFEVFIGAKKVTSQYGILGQTIHGKNIAMDLNETQIISLFGVQGAGKSYTIGSVTEMVLKQFENINKLNTPLAGVIFHYSQSEDYKPEFTSMKYANDSKGEITILNELYNAKPDLIKDIILLTPKDKVVQRQAEYPDIEVKPISFSSAEMGIKEWKFLMGAATNTALYIKQINMIMRSLRNDLRLDTLLEKIATTSLLGAREKELAEMRLNLAEEYIDDSVRLQDLIQPGRLLIVDLRDEFIEQEDALGLFVIMLNIFSNAKNIDGSPFNKFIVFDEAHKYMNDKDLTASIVTAIREMRHKGVSMMIASQDPPSLPNEIIELSTILMLHRFNSPQWLKHIKKSIAQLESLTPAEMANLGQGEAYMWASKSDNKAVIQRPIKIKVRPRVTKHGGGTQEAS